MRMDLGEYGEEYFILGMDTLYFSAYNGMQSNVRLILLELHCFLLVLLHDSTRALSLGFLHMIDY